jgi:poly(3-hydroxybutyrate) depolymerase
MGHFHFRRITARAQRSRTTLWRSGLAALAFTSLVLSVTSSALAQESRQTEEVTDGLNYLLYLPNGHDPEKKWPLIFFMHGFGERLVDGAEAFEALTVHSMPAVVESDDWDWPFIVVSPQIDDSGWINHADEVAAVLDRMETEFGADTNRLYLTGLSYGGRGTWQVGLELLDRFAALMPLCSDPGGLEAAERAQYATRPLFIVHGTADPTGNDFPTMESFVDAFTNEGTAFYSFDYTLSEQDDDAFPPAVLTERYVFARMIDYGHDVWSATYGRLNGPPKGITYQWLLGQSLDGSTFYDPRDPNAPAPPAQGGAGPDDGVVSAGGMTAVGGGPSVDVGLGGAGGDGAASPPAEMSPAPAAVVPAPAAPMNRVGSSGAGCAMGDTAPAGRTGALFGLALAALLTSRRRFMTTPTAQR